MVLVVKNSPVSAGDIRDGSSVPELDPLEEGMATLPVFLPENPIDTGAMATVPGVVKSQTRLKQRSMHSIQVSG